MSNWRRYGQFSLRSLGLFFVVLAVFLGWVRSQVSSIEQALRAEQETADQLEEIFSPENWSNNFPPYRSTMTYCDRQPTRWDWLLTENLRKTRHVDSITLTSAVDARQCLALAAHFPMLRSLHLRKQQSLDEAVAHLRGSRKLEELRWLKTDVTDAGLAHLAALTKLRDVVITDAAITDAGVAHLRHSPDLDRLVLPGSRVTDEGMAAMLRANQWNLQELNLGRTAVGDATIACLAQHSRLEQIRLHGTAAQGRTIEALEALPLLKRLDIDGPNLRLRLRNVAALESIQVPLAAEICLSDLPSLKVLGPGMGGGWRHDIKASRVELRDIPRLSSISLLIRESSEIENMATLKTLKLTAPLGIPPKVRLSGLPKLESLELGGVDWDDTMARDVSVMKSLKRLALYRSSDSAETSLSPETVRILSSTAALESLYIVNYEVPDDAARWLERLPRLKELWFRASPISPEAIDRLRRALTDCVIDPDHSPGPRSFGGLTTIDDEE